MKNEAFRPLAYIVSDKYGNYGIVGFCCFEKTRNGWKLVDFVMSCRVAQKKIERALFNYFTSTMATDEVLSIRVEKTDRNMPLCDELHKMPFENMVDDNDILQMQYVVIGTTMIDENIIEVVEGKE